MSTRELHGVRIAVHFIQMLNNVYSQVLVRTMDADVVVIMILHSSAVCTVWTGLGWAWENMSSTSVQISWP